MKRGIRRPSPVSRLTTSVADGQLWGNPLYRWEKHRETGYQWWITRLWYCFELYDVVRIDHFRGFDEYFSIPYGSETAAPGHWEKGPGIELFRAVEQALGKREIIAEDLAIWARRPAAGAGQWLPRHEGVGICLRLP